MSEDKRLKIKNLSVYLTEIDSFLRATAGTDDIFEAYSISEAIMERKDVIGPLEEAEKMFGKYALTGTGDPKETSSIMMNQRTGQMTLQAELLKLKADAMWAIAQAVELEEEIKKATPEELEAAKEDNPEEVADEEIEGSLVIDSDE